MKSKLFMLFLLFCIKCFSLGNYSILATLGYGINAENNPEVISVSITHHKYNNSIISGFGFCSFTTENYNGYEDYTSTLSSNVFNDDYRGLVNDCYGFGVHVISHFQRFYNLLICNGLCFSEAKFYNAYYDPLKILGNQGMYFINSNKDKYSQVNYYFSIFKRFSQTPYGFSFNTGILYNNNKFLHKLLFLIGLAF